GRDGQRQSPTTQPGPGQGAPPVAGRGEAREPVPVDLRDADYLAELPNPRPAERSEAQFGNQLAVPVEVIKMEQPVCRGVGRLGRRLDVAQLREDVVRQRDWVEGSQFPVLRA